MVPPEREMVLGEVVVNVPVVQAVVDAEVTVKPDGRTSENETPVNDVVVLGFVIVNVNVLVLPVPIEVGEKLLERSGTVGAGQPVKVILSRPTEALLSLAPLKVIRNVVVPVPVAEAV